MNTTMIENAGLETKPVSVAGTAKLVTKVATRKSGIPRDGGKDAGAEQPGSDKASSVSKTGTVLKKLRTSRGATIQSLMEATGWQAHSVRGFLSGTVRKKLGLTVVSEVGKDGVRHYRIAALR